MNFDDYLAKRSDLRLRVLVEVPEPPATTVDQRLVAIGGACLLVAVALHTWASRALIDPGYFARTSLFLLCFLLAGAVVLTVASFASAGLTGSRTRARESLKERTVARLIHADRAVVRQLAGARGGTTTPSLRG